MVCCRFRCSFSAMNACICLSFARSLKARHAKSSVIMSKGIPIKTFIWLLMAPISLLFVLIWLFTLSSFKLMYSFMRVSDAVFSFLTSSLIRAFASLTITRILSRSASVNSPRAGKAIAEKSIERTRMFFRECLLLEIVNHICACVSMGISQFISRGFLI